MLVKAICNDKQCYLNTDYVVDIYPNKEGVEITGVIAEQKAYTIDGQCYLIPQREFERYLREEG